MDPADEPVPRQSGVEDAAEAVSALEGELIGATTRTQFDALFKRAQELTQQIQANEDLGPLERAAVEQHLHELVRRARADYDRHREQAATSLAESAERIALCAESLAEAQTVAQIQEIRADLRLIRERIQGQRPWAPRDAQIHSWEAWQTANQSAWTALNERWNENERSLSLLLEQAETDMARGNPRGAKDHIKQFHEQSRTAEASYAATKALRSRARVLWDQATAASRERHEAYVVVARKRLDHLRTLVARVAQTRSKLEADMSALEIDLQRAQTDVASALLRGQLEERRRELRRLDSESTALEQRIAETERVLA